MTAILLLSCSADQDYNSEIESTSTPQTNEKAISKNQLDDFYKFIKQLPKMRLDDCTTIVYYRAVLDGDIKTKTADGCGQLDFWKLVNEYFGTNYRTRS